MISPVSRQAPQFTYFTRRGGDDIVLQVLNTGDNTVPLQSVSWRTVQLDPGSHYHREGD